MSDPVRPSGAATPGDPRYPLPARSADTTSGSHSGSAAPNSLHRVDGVAPVAPVGSSTGPAGASSVKDQAQDVVYAAGFVGPCGHPGAVMTVDELGAVTCWAQLSSVHDHSSNPPDLWAPDMHTDACRVVHCGTRFWPVSLWKLVGRG